MNAIKELERQRESLQEKLRAINDKIKNERIKETLPVLSKKYLGKCFTFQNSYSGGKHWNVYYFVYAVDNINEATCFEFQTDSEGQVTVLPKAKVYFDMFQAEIPYRLFAKTYAKMLKHIELTSAGKK